MNENRILRVIEKMKKQGLKLILISDPYSIYYLTGYLEFPGERFMALLLCDNGKSSFFLHEMFPLSSNLSSCNVLRFSDTDDITDLVYPLLDKDSLVGVDKNLPARFLLPLQQKNSIINFTIGSSAVDDIRGIKDSEEISLLEEVSHLNDRALALLKKEVRKGITESEIAEKLLNIYRSLGAEGFSFEPLIAFGQNAASPHHSPDGTILQDGDCVLFDIGCCKNHYCSDMTRTFYYRKADMEAKHIYDLVQKANEEAIRAIKPGLPICKLDCIARDIIEQAGYGQYFNHRLGHFIGLEVHEYGDISATNRQILQEGMIFSIEPGIYLPGNTGVRIEDLVAVTAEGCRILNQYPKKLEILD